MTLSRLLSVGFVASLLPLAAMSGCSNEELLEDGELYDVEAVGKADSFNSSTNPMELIKLVNAMPTFKADELAPATDIGKTIAVPTDNKPFSSDYWPMIKNGILNRWMGASIPSPAEKYGTLFLDATQQKTMYDYIQKNHGKDVPGVQSWFGICQGWTGSAIAEKAPQKPITVRKYVRDGKTYLQRCTTSTTNCVSFSPGDLTGLMAEAYAAADARFIGYRCDTATVNFKYDRSGRITQPNCRSNAGTLFLTATNFIKKAGRSFAVNAVNNDEVWNQPAYQYAISQYKTVTKTEATKAVDPAETRDYPWNTAAVGFRRVTMKLDWAVEASPTANTAPPLLTSGKTYDFILELDATGAVIGGEWIGASKTEHIPFFWAPVAPGAEVPNLSPDFVRALLNVSRM
ncbi:MAG TPA: hypothetical protein PKI03_35425 [Pseudomonadota bacterium]|nr:hypothetical protein [Pseudomonadota bacterium]